MKILLINNNTKHLKKINRALRGHDVQMQIYRPGLQFHDHDKDLVILSGGGGEGCEIDDRLPRGKLWYEDEMKFVLKTDKPLIGICMGFEVMARAYGQSVPYMDKFVGRTTPMTATEEGWRLFGQHELKQVELHSWHVPELPKGFEALVVSNDGIEVMRKGKKKIATQFHPELGGSLKLDSLIKAVV
jgi:GMP synthase-like glutamine amidotransferase